MICALGAKVGGDSMTGAFPWVVASVIAVAFATSEVFNEGKRRGSGLLRRLLVSGGIVLFTLVVAGVLCRALGFGRITYDHDPWLIHRVVIALLLFGASVSLARNIWLRNNPR
jgi:hypothetical protein